MANKMSMKRSRELAKGHIEMGEEKEVGRKGGVLRGGWDKSQEGKNRGGVR